MAKTVRSVASALTGVIAGASVMYYLDAVSGRRRRAELGERSVSAVRRTVSRLRLAARDLGHRAGGLGARAVDALRPGRLEPAALGERVRACLGRVVSHPGAISVGVDESRAVVLRGAVLAWEHEPLLRAVAAVSGVAAVRDELMVHESADHISALQGGQPRRGQRSEPLQDQWSPGMRLLVALAGGSLLVGSRRRGPWGAVGAVTGGVLLVRSIVNAPLLDIARGRGQQRLKSHLESGDGSGNVAAQPPGSAPSPTSVLASGNPAAVDPTVSVASGGAVAGAAPGEIEGGVSPADWSQTARGRPH